MCVQKKHIYQINNDKFWVTDIWVNTTPLFVLCYTSIIYKNNNKKKQSIIHLDYGGIWFKLCKFKFGLNIWNQEVESVNFASSVNWNSCI